MSLLNLNPLENAGVNVTTYDIKYHMEQVLKATDSDAYLLDQEIAVEIQLNKEEELCDVALEDEDLEDFLYNHIGDLDYDELLDLSRTKFYDPNVADLIRYIFNVIIKSSSTDSSDKIDTIRRFFQTLELIGEESKNGYAFRERRVPFKIVILKASKRTDNLAHEYVVGVFGTNSLREQIPNYAYVYGTFRCMMPIIDSDGEVASMCLNDEYSVRYVAYENIENAETVKEYVESCSGRDFLNIYMQVLYSEKLAHKMIDYTHYDLHSDNVLVRKVPDIAEEFQIKYETERGEEYIDTSFVATIIDYGFSHIETHELEVGLERAEYSIHKDTSFIMHDMYKFFMFTMHNAFVFGNREVLTVGQKIFKFWNKTEDFFKCLNEQYGTLYQLPYTKGTASVKLEDLALYIRSVCNCDFIRPKNPFMQSLNCKNMCMDTDVILNSLGFATDKYYGTVHDTFEFNDLVKRLLESDMNIIDRIENIRHIIDELNFDTVINQQIEYSNEILSGIFDARTIDFTDMSVIKLMSDNNNLERTKDLYRHTSQVINAVKMWRYYMYSAVECCELIIKHHPSGFKDIELKLNELSDIINTTESNIIIPTLKKVSEKFDAADKFFRENSNDISRYIQMSRKTATREGTKWYINDRKNISRALLSTGYLD